MHFPKTERRRENWVRVNRHTGRMEGEAGTPHDAMRRVGRLYLHELMQIDDAREGLAAFTEKRAPAWSGG